MAWAPLTTTITVRARGDGDLDRAWLHYRTPALWSRWSPQIRSVDTDHPHRPVAVGTAGTVHGPAGARVSFVVTDVDAAARQWTWQVQAGLITLELEHGVVDTGRGTQAWARINGPLPVVLAYAPLARLALGRLVGGGSGSVGDVAGFPGSDGAERGR